MQYLSMYVYVSMHVRMINVSIDILGRIDLYSSSNAKYVPLRAAKEAA